MKRNFTLAVCRGVTVIGALCCAITFAYQRSDADRAFQQARDLFNQHNWDKAAIAAGKALAADPNMGDAEILMGLIATVQSRFGDAEKHFLKGVALEPENHQAHAYLGSTYLQENKVPEATRAFKRALELNPEDAAANYNLGVIALGKGSATAALQRFQTVLHSNASDVPALMGVLASELILTRTADARRTVEQLQGLLQDGDPRLLQVAALLAEHGDAAGAIPILERVRKAPPQSWNVNYNLAVAYFQTGEYDRAAEVLRAFTDAKGKAEAFDLLGAIEEKRGRPDVAEHAFEAAVAREPSNEDYRFDYGNSLVQHGKFSSAVTAFRAAIADMPRSWKLRIGLGSAHYLLSDYENAARDLLEAVKLKPDSTTGWSLLGEAYDSASGLQREIETAFASYLESAPNDAGAYYHYGAILYQRAQADGRHDYRQAMQNVNQALRLDPNLAEAHFELGLIALAEGKTEQGIAALQKAVDLEPGLATARYRLGLAYRRAGNETRAQEELSRFRALKEGAHQRDRVLQSLAAISTSKPRSGEQP